MKVVIPKAIIDNVIYDTFSIHDAEHSNEDSDIRIVSSKVFSNSKDSDIHIVSKKASSDSKVDSDIWGVFTMAPPRGTKGKITDYFRLVSTSRINDFPQFVRYYNPMGVFHHQHHRKRAVGRLKKYWSTQVTKKSVYVCTRRTINVVV